MKFLTPFENACWAVLTQRTPPPVARKMEAALVEAYGGGIPVDGARHSAFPEPRALAAAGPEALLALLHHARKAAYLYAVACAFAEVDEMWLRAAPYDEVEAWLRAIDGIGPWSATFVLIRGLGRMERVDFTGEALLRCARAVYGAGVTPAELRAEIPLRYGASQGYWAYYLRTAE